ncbi:hypothetical protein C5167_000336 [Papaver somniferum]|uniref:Uncharacterized protein n=1 Tax=Papaver somniferum TaxID=3469 RepID=A0A4Y7KW51_PAPSO|nr:hypothetical protein C5167_000336 [Papaver somniferum]
MQDISQEAYELYSKRVVVILKETSEKLKIQAEKSSHDLKKSPEQVKLLQPHQRMIGIMLTKFLIFSLAFYMYIEHEIIQKRALIRFGFERGSR